MKNKEYEFKNNHDKLSLYHTESVRKFRSY